jgi:hypothetical protein
MSWPDPEVVVTMGGLPLLVSPLPSSEGDTKSFLTHSAPVPDCQAWGSDGD